MRNYTARNSPTSNSRVNRLILYLLAIFAIGLLAFLVATHSRIRVLEESEQSFTVVLKSLLPLRSTPPRVEISSQDPRQELTYELIKQSSHEIHLRVVEQKLPVGYPITVSLRCETFIPSLQWNVTKTITRRVRPRLLSSPEKIGTTRPILLHFNTPIDPASLRQNLRASFEYYVQPQKIDIGEETFIDTTTWLLVPTRQLAHDTTYRVEIKKNLRSAGQVPIGQEYIQELTTVSPLRILSIHPADGARNVPPSAEIHIEPNRKPLQYKLTVNGILQPASLDYESSSFRFTRMFLPDTEYQVELSIEDEYGETASKTVHFTTASFGNQMWIEVSLWLPNQVRIYRGKTLLKEMIASAGTPDTPTPTGWYRINGRGYAFFSFKYQEGAYYWVRFIGNYLFHSIPFDAKRQIKQSEAAKLGTPASHGCVRLTLDDAKWIYDNVPDGTVVIIHGPPQSMSSIASNIDETMVFLSDEQELRRFLEGVNQP